MGSDWGLLINISINVRERIIFQNSERGAMTGEGRGSKRSLCQDGGDSITQCCDWDCASSVGGRRGITMKETLALETGYRKFIERLEISPERLMKARPMKKITQLTLIYYWHPPSQYGWGKPGLHLILLGLRTSLREYFRCPKFKEVLLH